MLDEKPGKQWLDSFQAESRAKLASFPTPSLVTTAWGLALLQHRPKQDWVDRYLAVVEGRLGGMGACQLAKLLWALAALDCHPGQGWMDAWRQQVRRTWMPVNASSMLVVGCECGATSWQLTGVAVVTWALYSWCLLVTQSSC